MRITSKQRNSIADSVDDILSVLDVLDHSNIEGRYAKKESERIKPYLIGCDYHMLDPDNSLVPDGHGILDVRYDSASQFVDAMFPIDYSICVAKDQEGDEPAHWIMSRLIGPVQRHEVKVKIRSIPVTVMCRLYRGRAYPNGTWWAEEAILGLYNGVWTNMEAGIVHRRRNDGGILEFEKLDLPELNNNATMICSMALTSRYDWHVAIGSETGTRILLPSSPQGCLALLRDRDKDGTRRAALRHWVESHYRERTKLDLSYVRRHLRGKTKFEWHDLSGEVYVSKYDLERNEFFKNQTDEWRAARKHNKPPIRVRLKGLRP